MPHRKTPETQVGPAMIMILVIQIMERIPATPEVQEMTILAVEKTPVPEATITAATATETTETVTVVPVTMAMMAIPATAIPILG